MFRVSGVGALISCIVLLFLVANIWFDPAQMHRYHHLGLLLPFFFFPASYIERRSVWLEGLSKLVFAAGLVTEGSILFVHGGKTHIEIIGHEVMALSACGAGLLVACPRSREKFHGTIAFLVAVHGWSWMILGFYWSPYFSSWGIGAPTKNEHRDKMFFCAHWLVGVIWLLLGTVAYKSVNLGARINLECAFLAPLLICPGFCLTTVVVTLLRHNASHGQWVSISQAALIQYAFFLAGMSATAVSSSAVAAVLLWYHRKILKQLPDTNGLRCLSFVLCQPNLLLSSAASSWLLASCSSFLLAYVDIKTCDPCHIFFTCCFVGFYVIGQLQLIILNRAELILANRLSIQISLRWSLLRIRVAMCCAAAFAAVGMAVAFAFRSIILSYYPIHKDGVPYHVSNALFLFSEYCIVLILSIWPATWFGEVARELHASRETDFVVAKEQEQRKVETASLTAPAPERIGIHIDELEL